MTRYVWDASARNGKGTWVVPTERKAAPVAPYMQMDLKPYLSPLGTGVIDGRRARREDMARAGCREVDPSERLDVGPKSAVQAAEERAQLAARSEYRMSESARERLLRGV